MHSLIVRRERCPQILAASLLLTCIIIPLSLVTPISSQPYCQFPIDWERVQDILHKNLEDILSEGVDLSKDEVYLQRVAITCLASRGINKYITATVATEFLVTLFGVNQTQQQQFQMGCSNGVWDFALDSSAFDVNPPHQIFDIPLETQCSDCTEAIAAMTDPYYDADSNCDRKGFHD